MRETIREFLASEFRGNFPAVETAQSIDTKALEGEDPSPVYVTLAVAEIDKTSANGLLYDEALVSQLAREVPGKWGIFGHIGWMESDLAFPKAEVYWVGTALQGERLWAKGYVPPGEARETVRRLKATGAGIGTSIYGVGEREFVTEGQFKLIDFKLHQLDFAPTDRAALRMNSPIALTREMVNNSEEEVGKAEIIAALTAGDVDTLPKVVIEAVVAKHAPQPPDSHQIAEMRVQIAAKDRLIEELQTKVNFVTRKQFEIDLRALVEQQVKWETPTESAREKLAVLRETVYQSVIARIAGSIDLDKAKRVMLEIWEEQFRIIAETMRDALAGPAALIAAKQKPEDWRDKLAKNAGDIAKNWGGN